MFDPVMGRLHMETHDYQDLDSHSLHSFKDVFLIDFVNLPLKSRKDYDVASDIVLQTTMREYLSNYVVPMPADWPGQFFRRQIVYQKVSQGTATASSTVPQGSSPHPLCSVIPTLGPLHVNLNADEDIVLGYMPFMRLVYESLFSGKKTCRQAKALESSVSVGCNLWRVDHGKDCSEICFLKG